MILGTSDTVEIAGFIPSFPHTDGTASMLVFLRVTCYLHSKIQLTPYLFLLSLSIGSSGPCCPLK